MYEAEAEVVIADLGLGNLHSLSKAFERLGARARVSPRVEEWLEAPIWVLPGDGAFGPAARALHPHREALRRKFEEGPALGICLGMQLLFERSEEAPEADPKAQGLGVLPGVVRRLRARRLPHMGWNALRFQPHEPLFAGVPQGAHAYFIHSYGLADHPRAVAWTDYEGPVVAAVRAGPRSYATQFHPEKSSRVGLQILRNFLELARDAL